MQKINKTFLLILLSIVFLNTLVFMLTAVSRDERIDKALEEDRNKLRIHYEVLLHHQSITAQNAYLETLEKPGVLEILSQAQSASTAQRNVLRKKLQNILETKYERLKQSGVLQYHFLFPNNECFLRMHKPSKFGDDLSEVRKDFAFTNKTKMPIQGFTQGRTAHGFRNIFPIFDLNGKHLGAMEVSFSSEEFLKNLTKVSEIHTHFLVDKKIFQTNAWSRDDVIVTYLPSVEHDAYMTSVGDYRKAKYKKYNKVLLEGKEEEIESGIAKGEWFSFYVKEKQEVTAVSFFPVKNLDNTKALAWFVSYVKNDFIASTLQFSFIVRSIFLFFSLVLGYFIYKKISYEKAILEHIKEGAYHDGLTGVYNRKKFDEVLEHELTRNERYKRNLSIALVDVDHFKDFNDTYGHLVGDEVLKHLATTLEKRVRDTDTFARWGGEEFVILFPETNVEAVKIICDNLRKSIAEFKHPKAGSITASFGVTMYKENDIAEDIFQRCDDALYEAKEGGRNKVCMK